MRSIRHIAGLLALLCLAGVWTITRCQPTPTMKPASPPAPSSLSPVVPHDANFSDLPAKPTLPQVQHDFDVFSWQSFVALNWPARANGSADPGKVIGASGDNFTVWDGYREAYTIFLANGAKPVPWGTSSPAPAACQKTAPDVRKVLRMIQKVSDQVLDAHGQPFGTGPLVDQQNGRYVRYEITVNRDSFDYIVNHTLYNKEGQKNFTKLVDFPSGVVPTPTPAGAKSAASATANAPVGAIVIKAAWKVMGPTDHPERFHTTRAIVYTPASSDPPTKESCSVQTMGLVGLHIAHKTASSPQWVWSTFEQVDNVQVPAGSGLQANFYRPNSTYPVNQPPPRPWNPNVVLPINKRSQVKRMIAIDAATQALNSQWQARLRAVNPKSVWQFYELVSTQWPTQPKNSVTGPNATGNPAPQFLANTTLETYIQGKTPNVSSSCIGCHNNATTTNAKFSDFTYLLERAQSTQGGK